MKNYDVLYVNGKVFTSDKEHLYAESFAVKDGKIAWIGNDAEAQAADNMFRRRKNGKKKNYCGQLENE